MVEKDRKMSKKERTTKNTNDNKNLIIIYQYQEKNFFSDLIHIYFVYKFFLNEKERIRIK